MAKPAAVTDATFDNEVLQAELPPLNDFWATWCGPCLKIAPILEDLAEEYGGQLKVTKLDVDENQATAMAYGVMSIPTMILFQGGEPVERIVGFRPKEAMLEILNPYLASA